MALKKFITVRANADEIQRLETLAAYLGLTKTETIKRLLVCLEMEVGPQLYDGAKELIGAEKASGVLP